MGKRERERERGGGGGRGGSGVTPSGWIEGFVVALLFAAIAKDTYSDLHKGVLCTAKKTTPPSYTDLRQRNHVTRGNTEQHCQQAKRQLLHDAPVGQMKLTSQHPHRCPPSKEVPSSFTQVWSFIALVDRLTEARHKKFLRRLLQCSPPRKSLVKGERFIRDWRETRVMPFLRPPGRLCSYCRHLVLVGSPTRFKNDCIIAEKAVAMLRNKNGAESED